MEGALGSKESSADIQKGDVEESNLGTYSFLYLFTHYVVEKKDLNWCKKYI